MSSFSSPPLTKSTFELVTRRHARKKSSQILVEPAGLPANYVPMSPTLAVPHGLESVVRPPQTPDPYASMPSTPTHHSQPPILSPTPRNLPPPTSVRQQGHVRAASTHVDFGRSSSLHGGPIGQLHPGMLPILPTELKIEKDSPLHDIHDIMDFPPKTPTFVRVPSDNLRNRTRSSSTASVAPPPNPILSPLPTKASPTSSYSSSVLENVFDTPNLASVFGGASALVTSQFVSQIFTFILTQSILPLVGPGVLGAAAQLELLVNSVLFFSREAGRLATQRQSLAGKKADVYRFEGGVVANTVSGTAQEVVNMGFVSIVIGFPLSLIVGGLFYHFNIISSNVLVAITISVAASLVELISEPCFLLLQLKLRFGQRATFQSIAVGFRCVITFLLVFLSYKVSNSNSGHLIISFALGQLAYSASLTAMYIFFGIKEARTGKYDATFPRPVWHQEATQDLKSYFNSDTRILARYFWLQTIFKRCLSEGDKYFATWLLPLDSQGVYTVIVNYSYLAARLVFFPIEEALRNIFAKILSKPSPDLFHSTLVLSTFLRFYMYFFLFTVTLAPVTARFALRFLVSPGWLGLDAPLVFAAYAGYVPFLAIDGVLEAFIQSVVTPNQIRRQSSVLAIFSVTFALVTYLLIKPCNLGVTGLALANMFNMAQRIGWCLMWIETYFQKCACKSEKENGLNNTGHTKWAWLLQSVPSWKVLVPSVLVMTLAWFGIGQVDSAESLMYQCLLGMILLLIFGFSERSFIKNGFDMVQKTNNSVEEEKSKEKNSKKDEGHNAKAEKKVAKEKEICDLKEKKL